MKRLILAITVLCGIISLYAQSYDQERTALKNFLVRMYKAEPFEGVKVVSDYDNKKSYSSSKEPTTSEPVSWRACTGK